MSKKSAIKETKEKPVEALTRKKATRGKVVKLHRYWKGIATTFKSKAERRAYINCMLDAVVTEAEWKNKRRQTKETDSED